MCLECSVRFRQLRTYRRIRTGPLRADSVAKRFCLLERARLIQGYAPIRNVDSRIHTARFIRFKFIFHSFATETFATISAQLGPALTTRPESAFLQCGHRCCAVIEIPGCGGTAFCPSAAGPAQGWSPRDRRDGHGKEGDPHSRKSSHATLLPLRMVTPPEPLCAVRLGRLNWATIAWVGEAHDDRPSACTTG
jgi:hypothetical protein